MIQHLQRSEAYPHPVDKIELRETHISWVVLTGSYAYKIKKPVDLGFVDYTTLERRRSFCEEELRLNARFAPELYLSVIPITLDEQQAKINGSGEVIEYAVRMLQFDEKSLAGRMLNGGGITATMIDQLAKQIAAFHQQASSTPPPPLGTPDIIAECVFDNFTVARQLISDDHARTPQLNALEDWAKQAHQSLANKMRDRLESGWVRECHGDLHLGNIVCIDGELTPFDGIEFNPRFRWIDVMSEIAFLLMDLSDHGHHTFAHRFLNHYLERTGDYEGVRLLRYYLVYRAMVRVKVDLLRLQQGGLPRPERDHLKTEWHEYLDQATVFTQREQPTLAITHGLSGSGKTYGSQEVLEEWGAIRIRSDVERKRLFGIPPHEHPEGEVKAELYSSATTTRTYDKLESLSRIVLEADYPVIVDATFLRRSERTRFRELAEELGVPFKILTFETDIEVLRARVLERQAEGIDASDATLEVLESQIEKLESLTDEEQSYVMAQNEFHQE